MRFSLLPSAVVSAAIYLIPAMINFAPSYIKSGSWIDTPVGGLIFSVYMLLLYIGIYFFTVTGSMISSRKIHALPSLLCAFLSVLTLDFLNSLFLGISNQLSVSFAPNHDFSTLTIPVVNKSNYIFYTNPYFIFILIFILFYVIRIPRYINNHT